MSEAPASPTTDPTTPSIGSAFTSPTPNKSSAVSASETPTKRQSPPPRPPDAHPSRHAFQLLEQGFLFQTAANAAGGLLSQVLSAGHRHGQTQVSRVSGLQGGEAQPASRPARDRPGLGSRVSIVKRT